MTPTENKTLVENIMQARSRRDHAPFIAAMADDFVWRIIGSTGRSSIPEALVLDETSQRTGCPACRLRQASVPHRPSPGEALA